MAAQLMATARAEKHYGHVGRCHALDRLGDLEHLGSAGDDRSQHRSGVAGFQPPVLALDLVDVESPRDDQSKLVDVDRLAVIIIGPHRDRLKRALARAVAGGDNDFGVGLEPQDLGQRRETFLGAVGIGRQAEVERYHRRLVRT
jgi:hypothetical protein